MKMDIRKDFLSATSHLERLLLYGDEFAKNNRENWTHLKNKEDFTKIYGLDKDSQYKFERVYNKGRDLAAEMSFKLDEFNNVSEYPTLTSYVLSFYDKNSIFLNIKELEEISLQAKQKRDELSYDCPGAVEQMILLFDKQINLLHNIDKTLELIKTTDIYKIENGKPMATKPRDKSPKPKNTTASKNKNKKTEKPFFETIPGFITAFAALVTAIGGCVAIVLGNPQLSSRLFPPSPVPIVSPLPSETKAPIATIVPTNSPSPTITIPPSETPEKLPKVYDFQTCTTLCTGQNSLKLFSEKTTKIYAQFNYENFQSGIKYVRIWTLNGLEWLRYSCNWDGPSSGTEVLTLKEPGGLHSGTWEITILVNGEIVLKDDITVKGNWNFWKPAGTINACHGTVD
jgi:hypothetical protein